MTRTFELTERYHTFRRRQEICRFGVYGLTWEYFRLGDRLPPAEERVIHLEPPEPQLRVIQAVITANCNLSCTYCSFFANTPLTERRAMTSEELIALGRTFNDDIGPQGLLLITGGEPEMHPQAVNYLVENVVGTKVLFTNGTLTTEERLRYYQQHNVHVLFSLDGDLFAQEAMRRSAEGSYHRVARALQLARQLHVSFGISAVVGDHNIDRLPQLVEMVHQEFQPHSIGLNLPHAYGDKTWKRIEEYTQALIDIFPYARRSGLFVDQLNRRLTPLINRQFRFRDCASQGEKVVVYPGGAQSSCVNQGALTGRTVNWADRLPLHSDQCRDCYALGICGGGCLFDGEVMSGPGRFDERNCYFTQKLLEHLLWDFREELGEEATDQTLLKQRYSALLHRPEGTHFSVGHET